MKNKIKNIEELPYMLSAEDVANFIGISKSGAYALMKQEDFPSISVGKRRFVSKPKLLNWINNPKYA